MAADELLDDVVVRMAGAQILMRHGRLRSAAHQLTTAAAILIALDHAMTELPNAGTFQTPG